MPKPQFFRLMTIFSAALVMIALAVNRWLAGEYLVYDVVLSLRAIGLAVLAAGVLMAIIALLVRYDPVLMPKIVARLRPLKDLLSDLSQAERVYVAMLAGISEELLFRGTLQPLFGIAAASLLFGALHAVTLGYFLLAAAMGFYLGWLVQETGNLLVPMAVHALYDIFALNLLAGIYRRGEQKPEPPSMR